MSGKKSKIPAVILGDDPINGLGVARNLGRRGVRAYRIGAESDKLFESKYIYLNKIVPDINFCAKDDYITILNELSRLIGEKPVLFPISDLHVLKVAQYYDELEDNYYLISSNLKSTETLVNKRKFYQSLQEFDVPHPVTFFPQNLSDYIRAAEQIGYPVYIKPEISQLFSMTYNKKGFVSRNRRELAENVGRIDSSGLQCIIQEIIPGDAGYMCGCAGYKHDRKLYSFCYQRVREFPPGFGNGSLLISIPSFLGETKLGEYLEQIGYSGIFDAEFKYDHRDGKYKLVEINARSWWQNAHPTRSGINIIELAYKHAIGSLQDHEEDLNRYKYGVKWIYLYHDFYAARKLKMNVFSWLLSLRGERSFAIWAPDDPYPMMVFVSSIFYNKLLRLLKIRR